MSPVFKYQVRDRNGEKINGTLEGEDSSRVAEKLRNQGYYIISVNKKRATQDIGEYLSFDRRVKIKDLAVFSQQFAAMIDAGVSLVESLEILQTQIDHPRLQKVVGEVQEDVETGSTLSEAMAEHPQVFPDLYVQLINAGEAGGVLDQVLNNTADHYERQDELNGMVRSALYYPLAILIVAVLVVIFLVLNVVPTFVGMFESFGAQLPLPTRILLGLSSFTQNYWWAILIVLGVVGYGLYRYKQTPSGKEIMDKYLLKIPVIGETLKKIYISRFADTLSILLESGVDLLTSLNIVEDVVGNKIFADTIRDARVQVREGVGLSEPLSDSIAFPPMVVQMIRVGEETGSIDNMLQKVSTFYDREVESSIEGMISLIEPVMIVALAVVVGFVIISIVMPMFDMYQHI